MSIHAVLPNGGAAGLANLETAQKIVASPTLLAQFKKDTQLSKQALVSAVAWLKDLRSTKEAEAAASKIDAVTQSLLDRQVAFNEIVPVRDALGLDISLQQKASVSDWYLAYAAAAKLRETNKTYSTLTSAALSEDLETALHSASVDRVRRQLVADSRKYVAGKAETMPAPLKVLAGSEIAARPYNASAVSASISAASRLIDEAAAIPVNNYTVSEVFSLLMKARNELREIATTLRTEADARQTVHEEALLNNAWATLLTTSAKKAEVEAAAQNIKGNNARANGQVPAEWDSIIASTLPTEHAAIEAALAKLSAAVQAIPAATFEAELSRRAATLGIDGSQFQAYDEVYARP